MAALQLVVAQGLQEWGEYVLLRGDSEVILRFLTGEWKASQPVLYEEVNGIKSFIKHYHLKVKFEWVPRTLNRMAD